MFAVNIYVLCFALIGSSLILAEEARPEHDDRRFRFPFNNIGITLSRAEEAAGANPEISDRALFSLIPRLVTCNRAVQGALSCSSCNTVLYCAPNNVGIQRGCGTLYCNGGMCSVTPSAQCSANSNSTST